MTAKSGSMSLSERQEVVVGRMVGRMVARPERWFPYHEDGCSTGRVVARPEGWLLTGKVVFFNIFLRSNTLVEIKIHSVIYS